MHGSELEVSDCCLSVIIPTINESDHLPVLLDQLQQQKDVTLEVIVVDGGSIDNTCLIAESKGALLINGDKGRARQLNAGAKQAKFPLLLFIHADSEITDPQCLSDALVYFQLKLKEGSDTAGHFPLKFIRQSDRNRFAYRFMEAKTTTNRPYTINGDQGLLISSDYFQRLGGYDESLPCMEDQDIAAKIFNKGNWLLLPGFILTSGRRFETEGVHRRYILMSIMMALFWTGAHTFFMRAKNVYVDQDDTKPLKLWPYFSSIWLMLIKDLGLRQSIFQWFKVSRFVSQEAWQLFLLMDLVIQPGTDKLELNITRFYDRYLNLLINNHFFSMLLTPLLFLWYQLLMGTYFYLQEKILDRRSRS